MQNFTEQIPSAIPFEYDYCIGSFIWTGYDYLGESMGYPAKGWSGALIRTNNEYRPVAYMLKSIWSEEPVVHFSVMDYSLDDALGQSNLCRSLAFPTIQKDVDSVYDCVKL